MKLLLDTHAFIWFVENDTNYLMTTKSIESGNNQFINLLPKT